MSYPSPVYSESTWSVGIPAERIVVIPNGINEAHFSEAPDPESAKSAFLGLSGKLVLGFTGFVRDWHGVDRVVRWRMATPAGTAERLPPDRRGWPRASGLEALARSSALPTWSAHRRYRPCRGSGPRCRVRRCLAARSHRLRLALETHGVPLSRQGDRSPVRPNLMEVLTHDENALLFDARRVSGLEIALETLCADSRLRQRLSAGARQTIDTQRLTRRGNAAKVIDLVAKRGAR